MPEGTSESNIDFFTVGGHSHSGFDSTKIDYSRYELYDFVDEEELKIEVRKIVNSGSINPAGGVIIGDGSSGQPPVVLNADVPDAVTGTRAVTGLNGDNTTFVDAHWDPADKAKEYVVQLHRSEDSGSNYITISQVTVDGLSHRFDGIVNIGLITTIRYKIVVYARSNAGVIGGTGEISNVSPAVDTDAPAIPSFTTSETNMRLGIRGFMALVQENTEVDMKRGIGQYEWELASNTGFSTIVKTVRASSQIFNANGLTTGAAYYLRVKAIDSSENASGWRYWNGTGNVGATSGPGASITPAQIHGSGTGGGYAAEIAAGSITTADIKADAITANEIDSNLIFVGHTIQSDPYTAATTGWKIDKAGTGEFNSTLTMKNLVVTGLGGGGINVGSSAFVVTDAGAVTCTALTMTGGQITGVNGTGINLGGGAFTASNAGAVVCTNLTVTGGTLTGSTVQTAASGDRVTMKAAGGKLEFDVSSTPSGYASGYMNAIMNGTSSYFVMRAPRMHTIGTAALSPGIVIYSHTDGTSSIHLQLANHGTAGVPTLNVLETGVTITNGSLTVAGTITGNLTGAVLGNVTGSSTSCTGNSATATALATARTIGGVSFNGTANINLPGVNATGNQNTSGSSGSCTGNAATATTAGTVTTAAQPNITSVGSSLGIGTTAGSYSLAVSDASSAGIFLFKPSALAMGSNHNGYSMSVVGGIPDGVGMGGEIRLGGGGRGDDDVNVVQFKQGGIERMRIQDGGNIGMGSIFSESVAPSANLHVSSGTSGDCEVIIEADTDGNNDSDNPRLIFEQDGGIQESAICQQNNYLDIMNSISLSGGIRLSTGSTNGYTNATARLIIDSSGYIYPQGLLAVAGTGLNVNASFGMMQRDTSSLRYKTLASETVASQMSLDAIDALEPKVFSYKAAPEFPHIGLIAEDAHAVSPYLVLCDNNDGDPLPDSVYWPAVTSLLINTVKDLRTRLLAAESKIAALES